MNKEESINLLRNAKERLFERGWLQHSLGGRHYGPNCLVGAIHYELGNKYLSQSGKQGQSVYDTLQKIIDPYKSLDIDAWNDDSTRTFDEVIDVIDRTIKKFEMEG